MFYYYFSPIFEIVLALLIILLLWFVLLRGRNKKVLNFRDASLTVEELENHARRTAIEHSVSRNRNILNWPITRMNDNYSFILSVYKSLNEDIKKKRAVPAAAEWLLDNFYTVEEQVKAIRRNMGKKNYHRLPVLKSGPLKGYTRVFAIAMELVVHMNGQIDENTLLNYLKAYQSHSVLFDREIWSIPTMIQLALIENIRNICKEIRDTQLEWHKSDEIVDDWMLNESMETDKITKALKSKINVMDAVNGSFVEHLFFRLRRSGRRYTHVLRYMDENLDKFGTTTEKIAQKEHVSQAANTLSMGNCIVSLKYVSTLNWVDLFEAVSFVEEILKHDPDGTYPLMDLCTRNNYRRRVEELAASYGVSELHIAREAIYMAKTALNSNENELCEEGKPTRTAHVGYYLIGNGLKSLENRQKGKAKRKTQAESFVKDYPGLLYMGSISAITILIITLAINYAVQQMVGFNLFLFIIMVLVVLLPSSEIAVCTVNWIVCRAQKPTIFPRLELKNGILDSMSTMVVIPALIPDEKRTKQLLENMENHYLCNKEKNLYFALIGAFKDSKGCICKDDGHVIRAAFLGVKELNRKYATDEKDIFYFYHRHRKYNECDNNWIGWERKRGSLIEFNEMLLGSKETSFSYFSNTHLPTTNIKYVITLDADTILPMGMAKKMIGTMAHPLNKPQIDSKRGVVIEGYGLMQPRIAFDMESSNRSLFSQIYTGQEGIDPYASAISDVYQDLFNEGIFTGKGIYDLRVFQTILKDAIPENAVLSHDLLEGSYVRAALVTHLELVDSYPAKYNSFAARLHRWVRGDWQLLPWLGSKVLDSRNTYVKNPLSYISRWKIADNLRRSLIPPSIMILVILGFSIFPGSSLFWFGLGVVAMAFPFVISIVGHVVSGGMSYDRIKRYTPVFHGLKAAFYQMFLTFIFLPYQAYLMLDAIFVTLVRVLITKKNMLEWITSEDAERSQKNTLGSYWSKMAIPHLGTMIISLLTVYYKPEYTVFSLCYVVIWMMAPFMAYWISIDRRDDEEIPSSEDITELGRIARKTWRYFEEFANYKNNYLAPDNYQEEPPRGIAYRTSPTNIGLGFLTVVCARDFGYVGISEMTDIISKGVNTIEKMEKWNGHLYNWYDTRTLEPLRPAYVSTVDSGNLVGYLITVIQSLKEYLDRPIVDINLISGIKDTMGVAFEYENLKVPETEFFGECLRDKTIDLLVWNKKLDEFIEAEALVQLKKTLWKSKLVRMVRLFKKELSDFSLYLSVIERMPSIDLGNEISRKIADIVDSLKSNSKLGDMPQLLETSVEDIDIVIERIKSEIEKTDSVNSNEDLPTDSVNQNVDLTTDSVNQNVDVLTDSVNPNVELPNDCGDTKNNCRQTISWLKDLREAVMRSFEFTDSFVQKYKQLIERIYVLSEETKFSVLFNEKKHLFSIGYNIEEKKLTNSYYDLLASEARQTSYIAIARNEVSPKHWFSLGRALTVVDGYKGLVSWSGTMFEYLMPSLIMKSYKNTLLDETYSFVIKSQKKYGKQRSMPWGTSESSFNSLDINLDYQYKAIGVPWLGLKRGLIEDAVVAPYATFLALLVNPREAIKNIGMLKAEGLDGEYGFYEAADYTRERLAFETKRVIVKSFMAHHQGMSLVAIDNYLNKNIIQRRFHSDCVMRSARLLLQEKVPLNLVFTKETKEKVVPFKGITLKDKVSHRIFTEPNNTLPKVHILSNGTYSVMITDKGTGYSRNNSVAISRWREDSLLDSYGMFFYIRNLETNTTWSATYGPLNKMPQKYEVVFTPDKAMFKRVDGDIETQTEIVVTSGENTEIRRITLKNNGDMPCVLELTSYFEVVLAPQDSDLAHPSFGNLFVKTEFDATHNCIIANRRPRKEGDLSLFISKTAHVEGEKIGDMQFETDRTLFLGRGHNVSNPIIIEREKPLSNTVGPVLDPIMSIRVRVKIEPQKSAKISFVTNVSESKEVVLDNMEKYSNYETCDAAFWLAVTRSQVETKYLNIKASEMELYQDMISNIIFISPLRRQNNELIAQNGRGQSSLWTYGISGDRPIILVILNNTEEVEILYEVLKAQEYWRLKNLNVDLVILSNEENSYSNPLQALVTDIVLSGQTHEVLKRPHDVFILNTNNMQKDDINLFCALARLVLRGNAGTLADQVNVSSETFSLDINEFINEQRDYGTPSPKELELLYFNGLGGFGNSGSEYIIRLTKGQFTPAPWSNVIANPQFGFIVTESGGGYTWCENSRENKLTSWSNDPVKDIPSEVFYISDSDSGKLWSLTPLPIREEEEYIIKHGFGYTEFEHISNGIEQNLIQFVPVSDSVKVSIISLKNICKDVRNLTLTFYTQPVLGVNSNVTAMHIKTSQNENGRLLIENPYNEEFVGRVLFIDVSENERFVTGDRKEFFGIGDLQSPNALKNKNLSGNTGAGYDACSAMQVKISLNPNELKEIVFLLGMAKNVSEVNLISSKYRKIEFAKNSLKQAKMFWEEKLTSVSVNTPDVSMNIMLNGWLLYQVISCRLWARTAFYQSGGAFGFRDQLQDCLALMHIWPEIAYNQIIKHAKHQFVEGDVLHWWHEPQRKGTRTKFSDDLLWLPYVVSEYIRITGDKEILEKEIPFIEDKILNTCEDERYCSPAVSEKVSSLYEHCVLAIEKALKFGEHGLPLIGSGDWNDGMNTVGNKGMGESVWLGWFLYSVLEKFVPMCEERGDLERSKRYVQVGKNIANSIEENAWDGNWYKRAYFDNGTSLGSIENSECKIDAIAQAWSIISGAADPQRAQKAMNSLEDYLVMKEEGLIKLLTPPFNVSELEPGYIKGYVPGVRENGGQYTHAAAWVIIAYAMMEKGEKAWEMFDLINPINHTRTNREYTVYKVEPYVMAADVYAVQPHIGRGGWTWYTGSAGWVYKSGIENILGFTKNGDTLIIDPCIPKKWNQYSIKYKYHKTTYDIVVNNPEGLSKGVKSVLVDGILSAEKKVSLINDGKRHNVEILMGV